MSRSLHYFVHVVYMYIMVYVNNLLQYNVIQVKQYRFSIYTTRLLPVHKLLIGGNYARLGLLNLPSSDYMTMLVQVAVASHISTLQQHQLALAYSHAGSLKKASSISRNVRDCQRQETYEPTRT